MTPKKCASHELRPGEPADGERYTRALVESQTCWRCQALAVAALVAWKARASWRWHVRGERTAGLRMEVDAEFQEDRTYEALFALYEASDHFLECIDGAHPVVFRGQAAADEATDATVELRRAIGAARNEILRIPEEKLRPC